jgi:hypothetical protein
MQKQMRNWRKAMDDPASPDCLRFFLQGASKASIPGGLPPLFATLKLGLSGRTVAGAVVKLRASERVRVTDAGPFGVTTFAFRRNEYLNVGFLIESS